MSSSIGDDIVDIAVLGSDLLENTEDAADSFDGKASSQSLEARSSVRNKGGRQSNI